MTTLHDVWRCVAIAFGHLGPLYTRSQGRFETKSLLPIGWIYAINPKAFTQGIKTESRQITLMLKRQDLTRPQLQDLGPPRMEGQFVTLGPMSNFNQIWFFFIKVLFWQEIDTGGWIINLNGSSRSTLSLSSSLLVILYISLSLYNGLDSLAPRPLHTRVLAPVILLLKWPLEAELGAIRAKILVETAPTFDDLDSLCKAALTFLLGCHIQFHGLTVCELALTSSQWVGRSVGRPCSSEVKYFGGRPVLQSIPVTSRLLEVSTNIP